MLEELKQWWKKLWVKWWLLYYSEKRKNAEIRRAIQQTSYPTQVNVGEQWADKPRAIKEHNPQSIAHLISESDDSRATNNDSRAKWESVKRRCKGVATRDTDK